MFLKCYVTTFQECNGLMFLNKAITGQHCHDNIIAILGPDENMKL